MFNDKLCGSICIASMYYYFACPFADNFVKQSVGEVEGLQWDGAELFHVSASQEMHYHDAFTLMMVSSAQNGMAVLASLYWQYILIKCHYLQEPNACFKNH